jgi:hypothetical protein
LRLLLLLLRVRDVDPHRLDRQSMLLLELPLGHEVRQFRRRAVLEHFAAFQTEERCTFTASCCR